MYIRILTILLLLSGYSFAQTEQTVESIALGGYLSPLVKVQKDGKQYWHHLDGNHWIDKVDEYANSMFVVIKEGHYGVLKEDGNLIVPFEYDEIKIDTKYNLWDTNQYEYIFIILKKDGKTGVTDENGNIILPVQYENAKGISKNTIGFAENGVWGWASAKDGSVAHEPKYDYVRDHYSEGYVEIRKGTASGLAKISGEVIIPVEYPGSIHTLITQNGPFFCAYDNDDKAYLFDTTGTVVISGHVTYKALDHADLISYQEENGLWGMLDVGSKQTVIPARYRSIWGFVSGLSVVEKAGKQGVIKSGGKELLNCEYSEIRFLNAKGLPRFSAESVPQISVPAGDFQISDERTAERTRKNKQYETEIERAPYLIEVRKEQQQGIYDWNGKEVIPLGKYDLVQPHYYNGKTFYMLYADNKIGLADENGKEILPVQYSIERNYQYTNYLADDDFHLSSRFVPFSTKKAEESYETKIGLFDLEQKKVIVEPQEQRITLLNNRFIYIRRSLENYRYELLLYDFIDHKTQKLPDDVTDLGIMDDNHFLLLKLKNKLYRLTDVAGNLVYENPAWKTEGSYNLIRFPEYIDHSRGEFHHGLKKIYADEGNLFIDESGKEKRFDGIDQVDDFYEGFAVAAKKVADETSASGFRYKKGFININGNEILPFEFDEVTATGKGYAFLKFRKEGVEGMVRRDGTVVFEPVYDDIGYSGSGDLNLVIYKNGKYGLADTSGKIRVAPIFDELRKNYDGEEKTWPVLVKQGEWYYFVGKDGKKYPIKAKRKG